MTESNHKLPLTEKVGYSLGDAAANFVWRSTFFLPIFYTDTFGLTAAHVAVLLLVVRLTDGVTDIIMGSIADRTDTKHGKFRPWVLWTAPIVGLFLALLFTTPDVSYNMKLAYAYFIYFGLTLAYTANNVPYGALMGVMTPDVKERSLLSGFRFVGAFGGGLLVMGLNRRLVDYFGGGDEALGYRNTMAVFAVLLVVFSVVTFFTTKERIKPPKAEQRPIGELFRSLPVILIPVAGLSCFFIALAQEDWSIGVKAAAAGLCLAAFAATVRVRKQLLNKPDEGLNPSQRDLKDLLDNKPWLMLLIIGILFGLFTVVRPSSVSYYFKYYLHQEQLVDQYFVLTLVASLVAALLTGYASKYVSKRLLFVIAFAGGSIFSIGVYWVQPEQLTLLFTLAIIGEFFAGMMPVVFFSMLGDSADYSEWKHGRRATGLVYSAGTFIMKTGHGFAGAVVLIVLSMWGYNKNVASTLDTSVEAFKLLMSWIPGVVCAFGILMVAFYPLTTKKLTEIEQALKERRAKATGAQV